MTALALRTILRGLVLVTASTSVAFVPACSGAAPSSAGEAAATAATPSALALHGAYVPSSAASSPEYASLSFLTATTFFAVRSKCGGATKCRVQGTYIYDGTNDLALTDSATNATEHLAFTAIATRAPTATGASNASSATDSVRPLGLVSGAGSDAGAGGLVSASATSLLPTITAATIDGVETQHLDEDDPAATAPGPLTVPLTSLPQTVMVTLKVGRHGTPVQAMLDTGSSGIWIDKSVLDPRDGIDQQAQAHTKYGNAQQLTGEITSAFVTLGGVRTLGPIPVGVITAATCVGDSTGNCDDGSKEGIDSIGIAGSAHAIVGIGMDRSAARNGIVSPFGCMGQQTEQFILSVGAPGNQNARLVIDPAPSDQTGFTMSQMLNGTTDDGYPNPAIDFAISGKRVSGILDSGETEAVLKTAGDADTLSLLGQTDPPTTAARGVQLVDPVTLHVMGVADIPSQATSGVPGTLVQLRPNAVGNNLGILGFRGLDVFYDAWNGFVGVQPLTGEML